MLARVRAAGPAPLLDLREVHRFGNDAVALQTAHGPSLHWDVVGLYRETLEGLRAVRAALEPGEELSGIGIDAWAVDYGLLDADGRLLATPTCYRDGRSVAGVAEVHALVRPAELYARNGLQFLPFNTLYQLAAEPADLIGRAATVLLIPDLLGYWLTGERRAELTNASTTGLLEVTSRTWDTALADRLGLAEGLLPELIRPGQVLGNLLPHVAEVTGLPPSTRVLAVGSHDTASAVVGVPARGAGFGYVSCGTWSLVGTELDAPVLSDAGRAANFTNEGGVDGTVRYLRNVMGLWLLSQSLRTWQRRGRSPDLDDVVRRAGELPDGGPVIDPDDPRYLAPGDIPSRIEGACRAAGQQPPADPPALVRCILDSLAAAYARTIRDTERLSGRAIEVVHIVGGGSRNEPLCRLTAVATGLPVLAGPVEATAVGNVLVQARALGALTGGLDSMRDLVRRTHVLRTYGVGTGRGSGSG